jgi:hypothetical protein
VSNSPLAWLAQWEVTVFILGLAVTVALGLLTGRINTRYLLYATQKDGSRRFSPERAQLLVFTLAIASQYLLSATHSVSGKMPGLPNGSLQLLGLSNGIYLGGKGWSALQNVTKS